MARGGKHGAKVAPSPNVQAQRQAEERTCPLCIEPLDATEQQFFPCACGYQLCLFCYDRIKTECGNLCPGCRTEYGSEKDVLRKSDSRQNRNSQTSISSTEHSPQKHSPNNHRLSSPAGKAAHASPGGRARAVAAQAVPIPPPPPPPARPQPQWPQASHADVADSMHASSDSSAPSPSPQAARKDLHRQSATAAIPVPPRRRSQPPQPRQEAKASMPPQPGQDSSGSSSRLEQAGSGGSARLEHDSGVQQNGGHVQPQAWPAAVGQSTAGAPGFQPWRHQKKRRGATPPDPEGATLALTMQQAVKQGQVSSAQGAARLLAFLQQREAEQQMLSEACSSGIVGDMHAGQASHPSWEAQPPGSMWGADAAAVAPGNSTLWSQLPGGSSPWPPWVTPGATTGLA